MPRANGLKRRYLNAFYDFFDSLMSTGARVNFGRKNSLMGTRAGISVYPPV